MPVSFSDFISEKMKEKGMTREKLAVALGYNVGEEAKRKAQTLKHTITWKRDKKDNREKRYTI